MFKRIVHGIRRLSPVALWSLMWLILIDIGVNLAFAPPSSYEKRPSQLQRYFGVGRSIEGKLRRSVGEGGTHSKIAGTGWLGLEQDTNVPPPVHSKAEDPRPTVSIYGMSYAKNMRNELKKIDGLNLRFWGGPGAAPNHTYSAYLRDRGRHESDVVVFAIVTDAVRGVLSTTGATKGFDGLPFMYPRFSVEDGELVATEVFCEDLDCFRELVASPERWSAWRSFLSENDAFFAAGLFDETPLDASSTVRLARKAWSMKFQREQKLKIFDGKNFVEGQPNLEATRLTLRKFYSQARADGMVPVVLLFSNAGYGDALFRFFAPELEEYDVPFVSSHAIAPPSDPETYGPDGYHFRPELRGEVAEAFVSTVRAQGVDLRALAAPHATGEPPPPADSH